ncbi:MAG: hypothetical protein ACTHLT_05440 [Devosia sp.]
MVDSLSRKLTTVPDPEWTETLVTHFFMSDQGVTEEFVTVLLGFPNGDLPTLPEGKDWGVDGVISADDALTAINGANFKVFVSSGDVSPAAQVAAAVGAEGLYVIPFNPDP